MFYFTMLNMTELIGLTSKNDSNVRKFLDMTKEIALPKPNLDMVDDGFTPSQDLVDTKIFKFHIREYVNRLTNMKNGPKTAYSLAWGKCSEATRIKLQ